MKNKCLIGYKTLWEKENVFYSDISFVLQNAALCCNGLLPMNTITYMNKSPSNHTAATSFPQKKKRYLYKIYTYLLFIFRLDKVLGSIGSYSGVVKIRNDDDFADRLSHHYTPIILIIFTIVVSTKQYAGDPIQCWCPAQFTEAHVNYANQVTSV